jgi:chromosome segregation ATPase
LIDVATKKKSKAGTERQLKAQVKTLTADLADAKAKRDKWKKRARAAQNEVAELRKARKGTETEKTATTLPVSASDGTSAEPSSTATAPPLPDESWTLAALRDEARRRGVTGLSGKPKADVLAALRR